MEVSKTHAVVYRQEDKWCIVDLGGSSGLMVADSQGRPMEPLSPTALTPPACPKPNIRPNPTTCTTATPSPSALPLSLHTSTISGLATHAKSRVTMSWNSAKRQNRSSKPKHHPNHPADLEDATP